LRAEEIEAVEKAIEILSSGAFSGNSEKHLPQFVQTKTSLVQLRSAAQNPNQARVAAYLKSQASRIHSRVLSALATRVEEDPFKKVKKMVKDLIVKLMEEANADAEHKGFCDKELSTNEQTRKEKTEAIETLHAEIDGLEAAIAKLKRQITKLTEEVAELDAAVAKATSVRKEEKAKNTETIKDAQDAQTAISQALTVLKEFYDKAAEATSFVQQPKVFDEPYKGMGGEQGGVVGMIEVIQSDFARLESETTSAENEAATQYETFMNDSQVDKAQKTKDIEHKTGKKQNSEQMLQEAKTDLSGTQKELDAALSYYDKLKPSCVDAGESYEDRVARRKEEIESLQEALKILNGEAV
jgi:tetratricopeptide (TPR) repeat protein